MQAKEQNFFFAIELLRVYCWSAVDSELFATSMDFFVKIHFFVWTVFYSLLLTFLTFKLRVLRLQWSNLRLGFKIAWLSFWKIYILTASFSENFLHLLSRHKFASNHKLAQSILRRKFFSMYKPSWFCSANFPPYINPPKYGLWKIFAVLTSYAQSCTK